jgi:site-specific DNA-cytosine methylase
MHAHPPAVVWALHSKNSNASKNSHCQLANQVSCVRSLDTNGGYSQNQGGNFVSGPLPGVRRLTVRECERLQGFPDDFTNIEGAKDTPRYRALGNSMAVPVIRWIGRRIQQHLTPRGAP